MILSVERGMEREEKEVRESSDPLRTVTHSRAQARKHATGPVMSISSGAVECACCVLLKALNILI